MTFEYDQFADSMWVSFWEPASKCVYIEGQTPGVILRLEETTGRICGFEVLVWSRRISHGPILVPEINDPGFQTQWLAKLSELRNTKHP
jgi:hypothetical protein